MALASSKPQGLQQILLFLRDQGFAGELNGLDLLSPEGVIPWGGLFLPDPSIGRWALWRQPVGASAFSLIGQIHTLSTPAALAHLQDLVSEPVQNWDALICSSNAGRSVVEAVLDSREEALAERSGGNAACLQGIQTSAPRHSSAITSQRDDCCRHLINEQQGLPWTCLIQRPWCFG